MILLRNLLLLFSGFAGIALAQNPTICNLTNKQTTGYVLAAQNSNKQCHWVVAGSGSGDVLGPATNSANFFPQWNGTNSKTLLNGVAGSGSGNVCLTINCVMTTPNLGTPSAAVLTNATGLPIGSGVSGLAAGIATFLQTPSSANLLATMTTSSGTGLAVFNNTPTFITPILGDATATSMAIGASPPATSVCAPGTAGMACLGEGTTPTGTFVNVGVVWFDTSHFSHINNNNQDSYILQSNSLPSAGIARSAGSTSKITTSELSGDCATSGSNAVTCTKVNSVSQGASPATDSVLVVTAANTRTDKVIPDCPANALGYTQSTHAFGCNTIGGGGSSAFLDHQDPTGNITMTGSDVVIYSTSISGGTLAARHCFSIALWYTSDTAANVDWKLTYGTSTYTFNTTGTGTSIPVFFSIRLCNNAGVTNAQTLYGYYGIYFSGGPTLAAINSLVPVTGTYTADSTTTLTLALKANGASGTVTGQEWYVTVDR